MNYWYVIFSFIRHYHLFFAMLAKELKRTVFTPKLYIYILYIYIYMCVCVCVCVCVHVYICNTFNHNPILNLSKLYVEIYLIYYWKLICSRDIAVIIATGYGLDDRGVGFRVAVGSRIFISPRRPDRMWYPPNYLSSVYRWLFPLR
jgi:hypothetical protein